MSVQKSRELDADTPDDGVVLFGLHSFRGTWGWTHLDKGALGASISHAQKNKDPQKFESWFDELQKAVSDTWNGRREFRGKDGEAFWNAKKYDKMEDALADADAFAREKFSGSSEVYVTVTDGLNAAEHPQAETASELEV